MGITNNVIDVDVAEFQLKSAEGWFDTLINDMPGRFSRTLESLTKKAICTKKSEMGQAYEALKTDLKDVFQWMCNQMPSWHESIKQNITIASQGTTGRACTVQIESSRSFSFDPWLDYPILTSYGIFFDDALSLVKDFSSECTEVTFYFNEMIGCYKEIHECTNNEGLREVCASAASEIRSISDSFEEKINNFVTSFTNFVDEAELMSNTAVTKSSDRLAQMKEQFDSIDFETMEANVTLSQAHNKGFGDWAN